MKKRVESESGLLRMQLQTSGNAKLRYQITSGNTGGVFDVEPEVGTIFVAQPLDYEQNKRYKLHVLASDGKWEDYGTVAVNIVNKNDEAPVFTVNEYYGSVTEELDGSPVFVLQVQPIVFSDVTLNVLIILTFNGVLSLIFHRFVQNSSTRY
ncbi:unnamed protein product [Tetraodon nigroviridis]|uniref:(spotted green pufferfish) hypothetical protein n=1 Tax=Tetraodon nigroviridis TaxID=99883 RepID=Q4RZD5_TETNG|nr:unnamed protein product [Tetraodon nigroviridis]